MSNATTSERGILGAQGARLRDDVGGLLSICTIYGIYKFAVLGVRFEDYLYTYVPAIGGVCAIISLTLYFGVVSKRKGRSWWRSFSILSGFAVYFYTLYMQAFLGVYSIYQAVTGGTSLWSILFGLFWIIIGYRSLNKFYLLTELVKRNDTTVPAMV